jgi:hypothetical protein
VLLFLFSAFLLSFRPSIGAFLAPSFLAGLALLLLRLKFGL